MQVDLDMHKQRVHHNCKIDSVRFEEGKRWSHRRELRVALKIHRQGGAIWRQQLPKSSAEFRLSATDGKTYTLDDVADEKGTVVAFICNHCPYVKAVIDRMVSDARVLMSEGVGFAAICSTNAASYPEDSFENMKRFAKAHDFAFPYLHDETQTVARAYGAVCTPDFFGYNADRKLKYRGRLDEGRTTPPRAGAPRELVEAMRAIATTGVTPAD
jgi:peroxiredoxin